MQGGKNWILPKYINANRFFWDSHWLEIWSNHFCPSMGLNGGSVATDSGLQNLRLGEMFSKKSFNYIGIWMSARVPIFAHVMGTVSEIKRKIRLCREGFLLLPCNN
jgi:hypothetical protein